MKVLYELGHNTIVLVYMQLCLCLVMMLSQLSPLFLASISVTRHLGIAWQYIWCIHCPILLLEMHWDLNWNKHWVTWKLTVMSLKQDSTTMTSLENTTGIMPMSKYESFNNILELFFDTMIVGGINLCRVVVIISIKIHILESTGNCFELP